MDGLSVLRAGCHRDGSLRVDEMRSTPLITLRASAGSIYMVGGAATPLGGDDASLEVDVDDGAELKIRTVSAAVARRGPDSPMSSFTIRARVGRGASLVWEPETAVAAFGCQMNFEARIELAADSRLWWRDELTLGRFGEPPGSWSSYIHVDRGGRPLLRHHLVLGGESPGATGPAIVGDWRCVASLVVVGDAPERRVIEHHDGYAVALALAGGDAVLVNAAASDVPALRRLVAGL